MKNKKSQSIFVYADWEEMKSPIFMGVLRVELLRGNEIFSFEYDKDWLKSNFSQSLDPDLLFYSGPQYLNDKSKTNFGMFLDSSPDRWGRILMRRREAELARRGNRIQKKLFEIDYLLGVYDEHRMGALRFKIDINGSFQNDNQEFTTPPWTSIRELEQISLKLEENDVINDPDYLKWLSMLVAPGSSLGGARPKASVIDENNDLWIAKFPSKNDDFDIGGWEIVTYELALKAGIKMALSQAIKFSSSHHTFLTKRFDRKNSKRIHFASAMTLLGYTDGQDYIDGVSYLELVEFITKNGANVKEDLEQLWKRVVFHICVSNTDDHLRNHGFILTSKGWILSPAYDINPVETGYGLKLNISEDDNALDLNLALEVAPYFRINKEKAITIINEIKQVVRNWRIVADKYGISKLEQYLKSNAFLISEE